MNVQGIPLNSTVKMKAPDGHELRAVYQGYVPKAGRYKFVVNIGNTVHTTVLYDRNVLEGYEISIVEDEDALTVTEK